MPTKEQLAKARANCRKNPPAKKPKKGRKKQDRPSHSAQEKKNISKGVKKFQKCVKAHINKRTTHLKVKVKKPKKKKSMKAIMANVKKNFPLAYSNIKAKKKEAKKKKKVVKKRKKVVKLKKKVTLPYLGQLVPKAKKPKAKSLKYSGHMSYKDPKLVDNFSAIAKGLFRDRKRNLMSKELWGEGILAQFKSGQNLTRDKFELDREHNLDRAWKWGQTGASGGTTGMGSGFSYGTGYKDVNEMMSWALTNWEKGVDERIFDGYIVRDYPSYKWGKDY